jgi:hypothetical protein
MATHVRACMHMEFCFYVLFIHDSFQNMDHLPFVSVDFPSSDSVTYDPTEQVETA